MTVEKSAGAIIFKKNKEIKYLLLHYPSLRRANRGARGDETKSQRPSVKAAKEYWDLPKGHIEKGENELETVKREVEEETGLKDIEFIEGFKEWMKYFFKWEGKNILKFVTYYLAETKNEKVKISEEHVGYEWLPFEKALERLTFKNAREIIKKAHGYLTKYVTAG